VKGADQTSSANKATTIHSTSSTAVSSDGALSEEPKSQVPQYHSCRFSFIRLFQEKVSNYFIFFYLFCVTDTFGASTSFTLSTATILTNPINTTANTTSDNLFILLSFFWLHNYKAILKIWGEVFIQFLRA
jgi:hypothetical protein